MYKFLIVHPQEISRKWIDRLCALGVDSLGIHPVGGNDAHLSLTKMQSEQTEDERELLRLAKERGLKIEYEMHAASYLLPRELFAAHPEYFREDTDGNRTDKLNFCVTNPEALSIAAKRAADLADELYLSDERYYFWLDDGKDCYCNCQKCRELSPSDQQMLVLNAMIEEIQKTRPNAKLAYLAYFNTITPPKKVKPHKDIFLEYAPFERDRKLAAREMSGADCENIMSLLEFFGKEDSRVLEYWYDNSMFSGWKKPPKLMTVDDEMMLDDVDFYRSLGFENIGSFACYLGDDYEELYGEPNLSAFIKV